MPIHKYSACSQVKALWHFRRKSFTANVNLTGPQATFPLKMNFGLSKQYTKSKRIPGTLPLKSHFSHLATFYHSINYVLAPEMQSATQGAVLIFG